MLDIAPIAPVRPKRIVGRHFPAADYAIVKVNVWIMTDRAFADGGLLRSERGSLAWWCFDDVRPTMPTAFAGGRLIAGVSVGAPLAVTRNDWLTVV